MRHSYFLVVLAIFGLYLNPLGASITDEGNEELWLTRDQKQALDKFKERVIKIVPENYMRQDIYLNRFLRARNYDVNGAERLLLENLRWRKANKINEVTKEDFSDLLFDYPVSFDSLDRKGRPVVTANFGDWDVRKAVTIGQMGRLRRYVDRTFETVREKVEKFQEEGKNVTQWSFIINLNNYNVIQQGCIACIPIYVYLTDTYERHYPGHAAIIMFIDTPPVFEIVLNAARPFMSPLTRKLLKVYNKSQKSELFKYVDPSQLPPEYGGYKTTTEFSA